MGSLRLPFGVPQPPKHPHGSQGSSSPSISAPAGVVCSVAAAVGVGIGLSLAITHEAKNQRKFLLQSDLNSIDSNLGPHGSSPVWGSLCLAYTSSVITNPRTDFPDILNDTQRLLGTGSRQKRSPLYCFCKIVKYYTFGVRLRKFGGSDNPQLLKRFTSQFEDDRKVAKGSVIDLSREKGHVLRTKINGEELGSIESKILCQSILDLYIGEDPFDKEAKEEIKQELASFVNSKGN